jgi:hypothetical protein
MAIRIGIVVAAHPEDHSIDVIMTDDYSRIAGVQLLSSNGGAAYGTHDMFVPEEKSGDEKWSLAKRSAKDQKVAIDFSGPMPIAVGFIYPQIGQMTFADKNRRVQRHSSDVYSTLSSTGDMEVHFPNGTFFRIGASPDHEDLAGKDADGNWAINNNTGAATHLRLVLGNGGAVKADLHIDPSGNVTGTFQGTGNLTFIGDVVVNAPNVTVNTQTATVNASTKVELATPLVHCTQALTVEGLLTYKGGLVGSGGSGAAITGNVATTGTLTNNGKAVGSTHTHLNSGGSGMGGLPS